MNRLSLADREFALNLQNPDIFHSALKAHSWAKEVLKAHDNDKEPWYIQLVREKDGSFCAAISQASWAGDHCGQPRGTGALAIIQAVLEYTEHPIWRVVCDMPDDVKERITLKLRM